MTTPKKVVFELEPSDTARKMVDRLVERGALEATLAAEDGNPMYRVKDSKVLRDVVEELEREEKTMDDKYEELQASLIDLSGQLDHAEGSKFLRLLADVFSDEDEGRAAIKAANKAIEESRLRYPPGS